MSAAEAIVRAGVIPLWIAAGLCDWLCHRRTGIQHTSGLPENVFHWLLLAEGGVAVAAAALLETNAAVLLVVFAAFAVHELTTWIELRYTVPLREVRPIEQMVHSFMEILPLALGLLLGVAVIDGAQADFGLRMKEQPWPAGYLVGAGVAVLLLNVVPLVEESLRCVRGGRRG